MELGFVRPDTTPLLNEETSGPSSLRSSLDNDYYQSQGCDIHIYDDISSDQSTPSAAPNWEFDASTWHGGLDNREGFTKHLKVALVTHRTMNTKLTGIRLGIRAELDGCRHPRPHEYKRTKT